MITENESSRSRAGACPFRPILAALTLLLPAASGCEDEGPPPAMFKRVKVEALPEVVRAAAAKALPDIKLEEAWENLDRDRKLQSYEVKGRNARGKIREARVALDGKILETE